MWNAAFAQFISHLHVDCAYTFTAHNVHLCLWGCNWSSVGLSHQKYTSIAASHKTMWIFGIRSSVNTIWHRFSHLKSTIFLDLNLCLFWSEKFLSKEPITKFPTSFWSFLLANERKEGNQFSQILGPNYSVITKWLRH